MRKIFLWIILLVLILFVVDWWKEHNLHSFGEAHGPQTLLADEVKLRCGDIIFYRSGYRKDWINFSYLDHVGIVIDDDETVADFMTDDGLHIEPKMHTIRTISKKATILVRRVKRNLSEDERKRLSDYIEECKHHSFDSGFMFLWILNAFGISRFNDPTKQNCTSFVYGAVQCVDPELLKTGREAKSVHISEYASKFPLLSPRLYYEEIILDHTHIPRFFSA